MAVAIVAVTVAIAFRVRSSFQISGIGSAASLIGLVLASVVVPTVSDSSAEVFLTNHEYNRAYWFYLIQLGCFAVLALLTGGLVGRGVLSFLAISASAKRK